MAKKQRKNWIIFGILAFLLYFFIASVPIPMETVLENRWMSSVEDGHEEATEKETEGELLPFRLNGRIGYADQKGRFSINRSIQQYATFSDSRWTEYAPIPEFVEVYDPQGNLICTITEPGGYPVLLGERIFIISPEQESLSALDSQGTVLWRYDFQAPLTALDASDTLVLAAGLDGSIVVLDAQGTEFFTFEPGGSRLAVIPAARISSDGTYLALISGIDAQRFLLLERFSSSYKVVYHEFLEEGFRRPVLLEFINGAQRVIFERQGGLGIYVIGEKTSETLPIQGQLVDLECCGEQGFLFFITSEGERKNLMGIDGQNRVMLKAPFISDSVFIGRRSNLLFIGGDSVLSAFLIKKK